MGTFYDFDDVSPIDLGEGDIYDDPYDVVMYDIETEPDDLYALIDMLGDTTRYWYARRRLNALAAAGPLSSLVAAIIIDSLGRRWNPLLHPRDRYGRFIQTGGFLRWLVGNDWLRGRVDRIDSDGNIHVSAAGNDRIPDGSIYRFKPQLANKLVSTESPVASLKEVDLDSDIPDFPEATPTQKRIWNSLATGDMPAADLDRSMADLGLTAEDFGGEVRELETRGLIEIDRSDNDNKRVRRLDGGAKAVIDVGDADIADVPDDDTPDLDDSPALTRSQRDLLDRLVEMDRGEGDGIAVDEMDGLGADAEDLQALIDAEAVEETEDGRLFLVNPEGGDVPEAATPETDVPDGEAGIEDEVFNAAEELLDDIDEQEAFQHYALELARPGDENNAPLPEGISPGKRRRAEAAANQWWVERNGDVQEGGPSDVPDEEQANPRDVLNPRNQALADELLGEYFPDGNEDLDLDSDEGTQYREALKHLFDAEDLEENGFDTQAGAARDRGNQAMRDLGIPEEDIEGWPIEVQNMRNADRERAGEDEMFQRMDEDADAIFEAERDFAPVQDDEVDLDAEEVVYEDVERDEGPPLGRFDGRTQEFQDRHARSVLEQDARRLDEYITSEGVVSPETLAYLQANKYVEDDGHGGYRLSDSGQERWDEAVDSGLLGERTLDAPEDVPEAEVPGAAPDDVPEELPEDVIPEQGELDFPTVDDAEWDAALDEYQDRLANEENAVTPDEPDAIEDGSDVVPDEVVPDEVEDVVDDTPGEFGLSDAERDLLERIDSGGTARRSERGVEDNLIEAGYLEEDDNGDSRLTNLGRGAISDEPDLGPTPEELEAVQALDEAEDDGSDIEIDDTPLDLSTDLTPEEVTQIADDDLAAEEAEDAVDAVDDALDGSPTTSGAPTLPDPSDPNDATPGFVRTGGPGGLNAGGFYDVTEDNGHLKAGDRVYIKNGRSPEHAQNEALANRLYALAGAEVPDLRLGNTNDRLVSKIVDDDLHGLDIYDPADADAVSAIRNQFAIDAWIANWDGMNPGNTLVGSDGTPYRIDVGSAMEFRAQGQPKGAAFGDTAFEIDTLRDPSMNYDTALVYGPISDDELRSSVERLARVDPDEVRSLIEASDLPDKDALADKMITRRERILSQFGVADPYTVSGDGTAVVDGTSVDSGESPSVAPPTPAITSVNVQTITAAQQRKRTAFYTRTNPYLEPSYDSGGDLVMADGTTLDYSAYYHTGAGGEGKHGQIVEVLDQERFPGWVRLKYLDGEDQIRHVLGDGKGRGGLRRSSQEDVDEWERQASVVGDKAEDAANAAEFPMADGEPPLTGARVVFDVGGEDQYGVLLYFNPKWDNGGRAYIIPDGGGKIVQKPVRNIRSQTPEELDADEAPRIPYQQQGPRLQHLPFPKYTPDGNLLSREGQEIRMGDWLQQRSGGDGLVGEVVGLPDQNLYPGWVTLRFPDGEVRTRHVEGFTDVNKTRGEGGLRHAQAPDVNTWTRQRRVKGEDAEVLSYDFSTLATSDGTPIQVGEEAFGTDRRGRPVSGLLIRINPHLKRNGEVVPTGFIWQNGREVTVDVDKITNTRPQIAPVTRRVPRTTTTPTPSGVQTPTGPRTPSTRVAPEISSANTPPAYTPNKGRELTDDELDELDFDWSRLQTSPRTNGNHAELAALYEAQDFDALPIVVDQTEFARLVNEEGYVPMVRSVSPGVERTTNMDYDDAYKYGAYFVGSGGHGNGSYFAYGDNAISETRLYASQRIYAAVRPGDLKLIDKNDLIAMMDQDAQDLDRRLSETTRGSPEYEKLKKIRRGAYYDLGHYAAMKGYDAIVVPEGNSNYGNYGGSGTRKDNSLSKRGYFVLLNRSAAIVSDTHFEDRDDIFNRPFPQDLAPPVAQPTPPVVDEAAEAVDETAEVADEALAPPAAPGVV